MYFFFRKISVKRWLILASSHITLFDKILQLYSKCSSSSSQYLFTYLPKSFSFIYFICHYPSLLKLLFLRFTKFSFWSTFVYLSHSNFTKGTVLGCSSLPNSSFFVVDLRRLYLFRSYNSSYKFKTKTKGI